MYPSILLATLAAILGTPTIADPIDENPRNPEQPNTQSSSQGHHFHMPTYGIVLIAVGATVVVALIIWWIVACARKGGGTGGGDLGSGCTGGDCGSC